MTKKFFVWTIVLALGMFVSSGGWAMDGGKGSPPEQQMQQTTLPPEPKDEIPWTPIFGFLGVLATMGGAVYIAKMNGKKKD